MNKLSVELSKPKPFDPSWIVLQMQVTWKFGHIGRRFWIQKDVMLTVAKDVNTPNGYTSGKLKGSTKENTHVQEEREQG